MQHIGFIMDGNRRWAKKLGNIARFGHEKGFERLEHVLQMVQAADIPVVSFWGLSKENILERSQEEINAIYDILRSELPGLVRTMQEKGIRFQTVGDLWLLPQELHVDLMDAVTNTREGTEMTCILAIGYSGQDEIVRAVQRCMREGIDPNTLNERYFLEFLDSGAFPPPDLIVRTGGHIRHSGYFLYQSAYSEYFFTDTFWPDFSQKDFDAAVEYYASTQRNFGK